ncbi:GntR family transcriptional regulator [Marinibacterium sp. SX1]|uniref:GntR family transcriptional regulator n=1 Tax=Marinibacterium sp. SX1 TaxID=3388424 RepID=UPI003D17BD8A
MRVETPEIFADLQRKLMTAELRPGTKLKPSELQGFYGCSANTVRDVLLRLSKVGLVEFEMQRGFRVRATTPERRHDVTRFRILLEQEGARLSMLNGGVGWESRLTAAHHKLSHIETQIAGADDVTPYLGLWSDAELEFHETLISSCGSPILRETYSDIYAQFRQQMVGLERDFGSSYFHSIIDEHQAVLDAALARDVEACRTAIYDHLKRNL